MPQNPINLGNKNQDYSPVGIPNVSTGTLTSADGYVRSVEHAASAEPRTQTGKHESAPTTPLSSRQAF